MGTVFKRFLLLFLIIFLSSCTEKTVEDPITGELTEEIPEHNEPDEIQPIDINKNTKGLISYLYGDVYLGNPDLENFLDIGDEINPSDIIHVGQNSYCDIQLNDIAVIHLEENTILDFKTINIGKNSSEISAELTVGKVLCKVNKLLKTDEFSIKTPDTAAGVRGTRFIVSKELNGPTTVAVTEGAVALQPLNYDLGNLKESVPQESEEIHELIRKVESQIQIIKPGFEQTVEKETLKKTEELIEQTQSLLVQAIEAEKPEEIIKEIEAIIETESPVLQNQQEQPRPISETSVELIEKVDNLEILPSLISEENQENLIIYKKVIIETNPEDAEIFINDQFAGTGAYSRIHSEEDILQINVRKENYESEEILLNVKERGNKNTIIILNKAESSAQKENPIEKEINVPAESDEAEDVISVSEEEPAKRSITITSVPDDASIHINDQFKSKGIYSEEYTSDSTIKISISRFGYNTLTESVTINMETPENLDFQLEKNPIINRIPTENSPIVKEIVKHNDKLIISNQKGSLFTVSLSGKKLWSSISLNNPNNSYPTVHNNRVYASGIRELQIRDLLTGDLIGSRELSSSESHMFGRKIIAENTTLLYPTNETLQFIDNTGQIINEITIPDGSRMTPLLRNNKIYIANQLGELYIIDRETLNLEKSISTGSDQAVALSPVSDEKNIIFSGRKGNVCSIDIESESIVWETDISDGESFGIFTDIEVGKNSLFLFGKNQIISLSKFNGSKNITGIIQASSPPVYSDDFIYFGDNNNLIKADASTGEIVSVLNLGSKITTRPILDDQYLIVGTENGEIILIAYEFL